MVVKGEIQTIDFLNNTCRVRLPFFESANSDEVIVTAIFSISPGMANSYQPGDIVIVGFGDGLLQNAIVLGKLCLDASTERGAIRGDIQCNSISVGTSCRIPLSTSFSNIDAPKGGVTGIFENFPDLATTLQLIWNHEQLLSNLTQLLTTLPGYSAKGAQKLSNVDGVISWVPDSSAEA